MVTGVGRHATLHVPGHLELSCAPADWPDRLHPGSLNVQVDKCPVEFGQRGLPHSVEVLDTGWLVPAFEIPKDRMGNNKLRPRPGVPRGGDAQVWRAILSRDGASNGVFCWALRRFGSRVGEQLEFVAGNRLRDFGFNDGIRVKAMLLGKWHVT